MAHHGRAGAQSAVAHELERPHVHTVAADDLLERKTVGRLPVGTVRVGLKILDRRERSLRGVAHQVFALFVDALQHPVVGRPVRQIRAQIHALHRGDAPGRAVTHGGQDGFLQFAVGQIGDEAVDRADRGLLQVAVRLAVFAQDDFAALDRMVILIEPHILQQHGVYRAGMLAAPHDGDGDVGGDAVQIVLVRQSSVPFRPLVLPPALALQAFTVRMLCQVLLAGPDDVLQISALRQIRHHHLLAKVDQVHVGIVKAGDHRPAFAVDLLRVRRGQRQNLVRAAHRLDPAVFLI